MGIDVNPEACSSFTKVWTHTWLFTVCFSYVALCEVLPELIITLQLLRVTERDVRRRPQRALSPTKGPLPALSHSCLICLGSLEPIQPSPWGPCDVMCCQSWCWRFASPAQLCHPWAALSSSRSECGVLRRDGGGGKGDFKGISGLVHFAAAW